MKASTLDLIVDGIIQETADVKRLRLVSVNGEALPSYQAGAHVALHLPSGLIRPYSLYRLSNSGKAFDIAVLREPSSRGGSAEIHRLKQGDRLQSSPPQNHFSLVSSHKPALLMAAGIGVTPLITMAQALTAQETEFLFHYSAKSASKAAFYQALQESNYRDKVQYHFTLEQGKRADLKALFERLPDRRDVYVCGPSEYIQDVLAMARSLGWPDEALHSEYFKEHAPAMAETTPRKAFQVKLASTGEVFEVEEGLSITQTLELNGVDIPVSCEEGWCGTCLIRVLEGTPDHRDTFLSDGERAANDVVMPCCSRSYSACLVLDI